MAVLRPRHEGKRSEVNSAYEGLARLVRAIEEEKRYQVWFRQLGEKSEMQRRIEIEGTLQELGSVSEAQAEVVKYLRLLEDPRVFGAVWEILRRDGYIN
ncbi:MAG: hypothetical protein HY674_04315 [Chloroflexi bacterium]|nr:hypothetical protein [Chloroflexota bacterium]